MWVIDWERDISTRLTFDDASEDNPIWSPDGLQVTFNSTRKGQSDIFVKNASGVGDETLVVGSPESEYPEDWSRDGRYISYVSGGVSFGTLNLVPLFGDRKPFSVVRSPFQKDEPHFSPDGKWLAYDSSESGIYQIYLVSLPTADQKLQVSTNGGAQPHWRRDGKELYYLTLDGKMMAVDISTGAKPESSIPRVLFDTGLAVSPTTDQYAVTSDGQRFLLLRPLLGATPTPITVVLNWVIPTKK